MEDGIRAQWTVKLTLLDGGKLAIKNSTEGELDPERMLTMSDAMHRTICSVTEEFLTEHGHQRTIEKDIESGRREKGEDEDEDEDFLPPPKND